MIRDEETEASTAPLERMLGDQLTRRGLTIAVAESCTGGLISHRITDVPGASKYFLLGAVAYSNECKVEQLGVDRALIEKVTQEYHEEWRDQWPVGLRMLHGAISA